MLKCGSTYFFANAKSKDIDYLELVYSDEDFVIREFNGIAIKQDVIQINMNKSKDEIITYDLNRKLGMALGKYLIPEFNKALGITLDDLKKLKPLIKELDKRHEYEKIIYDSYIKNKKFELNYSQWLDAYNKYMSGKPH
jgi:hypothetical protein